LLLGACALQFAPAAQAALPVFTTAASTLPNFADLVEKSAPVVVNIRTTEKSNGEHGEAANDEQMQEFLRRYFGGPRQKSPTPKSAKPPVATEEEPVQRGVGSGFVIAADGYVLTNAHVVKGAEDIFVTLNDKREFTAKVVGLDERTDVALLKIDASKLPQAQIGASASTRVGEWVIAIGSPFDLDNTVTAGIVSAKARETGDFLPLIQTDVAVNPGNSGGPLINMRGEVVGINSQIYSRSGGYMGISFAIPIEEAIRVADQLKASGHVSRGRIGVYLDDVGKDIAESLGLPKAQGSLVGRIEKGGPADKAGLLGGDIILNFNGVPIEKSADLRRLAAGTRPGTQVKITLWRKGAAQDAVLTVAELEPALVKAETTPSEQTPQLFGLQIEDVPEARRRELGISSGIVITDADGTAARAGLQPGDIILTVNNQDVTDARQFASVLSHADKKKGVLLLARRGDVSQYITLRRNAC
jgi:serine protease Do